MSANGEKEAEISGSDTSDEELQNADQGRKFLIQLLEKLKVPHLLPKFAKEEVDDDYLYQMNLEDEIEWGYMADLLPTVGCKGGFRRGVQEYKVSNVTHHPPVKHICAKISLLISGVYNLFLKDEIKKRTKAQEKPKKREVPKHYNFFNHNMVRNSEALYYLLINILNCHFF